LATELYRAQRACAADFCLLCIHLLCGWDVFSQPLQQQNDNDNAPYYLTLLHATDGGNDMQHYTCVERTFLNRCVNEMFIICFIRKCFSVVCHYGIYKQHVCMIMLFDWHSRVQLQIVQMHN
jgi:hypothetical protein